jgi:Nuclease-related domain
LCAPVYEANERLSRTVVRVSEWDSLTGSRPGAYAWHLTVTRAVRLLAATLTLVAGLAVLGSKVIDGGVGTGWALAGFVWFLVCGYFVARYKNLCKRAYVGYRAEKKVGKILEKENKGRVLHGVLLNAGGDADHVGEYKGRVWLVETKAGYGPVSMRETKKGYRVVAGVKVLNSDPVGQVRRQRNALATRLGVSSGSIVSIVVIADGWGVVQVPADESGAPTWIIGCTDISAKVLDRIC